MGKFLNKSRLKIYDCRMDNPVITSQVITVPIGIWVYKYPIVSESGTIGTTVGVDSTMRTLCPTSTNPSRNVVSTSIFPVSLSNVSFESSLKQRLAMFICLLPCHSVAKTCKAFMGCSLMALFYYIRCYTT